MNEITVADPDEHLGLPGWIYSNPRFFAVECERVLAPSWQVVCHLSDIPRAGDFHTFEFIGESIVVVRGRDGVPRAFSNVCLHRGARLIDGPTGQCGRIVCPYHAWTYDLSGRVRGIPDERCFAGVRHERSSLTSLPLCEKHGLVWVIPTPARAGAETFDIDPYLSGLGPELASYGFASWSFYDKRVVPESLNWKILVETFHEGYHIGFLHRDSLKEVLHGNVTDFEAFGPNHRLVMPRKKLDRLKSEPEQNWDLMWNTTLIYALFPNTLLVLQGDHVELARIFPREGRVDRAVMDLALYVPKAPTTEEERIHWEKNMQLVLDVVTGEDFPTGRTIQIGLTSGAQDQVVYGRNEPAMIHYHRSLRSALGLEPRAAGLAAAE